MKKNLSLGRNLPKMHKRTSMKYTKKPALVKFSWLLLPIFHEMNNPERVEIYENRAKAMLILYFYYTLTQKKNDRHRKENYRSTSIFPVLSKEIWETFVESYLQKSRQYIIKTTNRLSLRLWYTSVVHKFHW